MEDDRIVELFFERSEDALAQTQQKYGKLAQAVAGKLLDNEDSEECVNDAYMKLWSSIPPDRPKNFRAYLCRVVRNIALDRLRYNNRLKRSANYTVSLEELEEAIPDSRVNDSDELEALLNKFLAGLKPSVRNVFICKYWFFDSVKDITARYGYTENKVNSMLARARKKLRDYLKKEGYFI